MQKAALFVFQVVDGAGATGPLLAEWFNPFTGQTTPAGNYGNGTAEFNPPPDWSNAPLVLHLRAK